MFNVENFAGKVTDFSFVNYVTSFDFACLTETFADSTFDFNVACEFYRAREVCCTNQKLVSSGQKFRRSFVADRKNCVQICEADPN